MTETIPITIVPRYGCLKQTTGKLKEMKIKIKVDNPKEHISSVITKIAKENLHKLCELRNLVDIIALSSVEATILDKTYKSRVFENLRVYSSRFENHRGVMSGNGKSEATYHGIISRDGPTNKPVKLLLQFIKPNAKTSNHYHEATVEFFLPLLGKTLIHINNFVGKFPQKIQELKHSVFTKILPKTAHQLKTLDLPSVNLLCMDPYDPDLEDHHYLK